MVMTGVFCVRVSGPTTDNVRHANNGEKRFFPLPYAPAGDPVCNVGCQAVYRPVHGERLSCELCTGVRDTVPGWVTRHNVFS